MLKQLFLVALILGLLGGLYFLVGALDTSPQLTGFAVRDSNQQQPSSLAKGAPSSSLSDDLTQTKINSTPEQAGASAQFHVAVRVVPKSQEQ